MFERSCYQRVISECEFLREGWCDRCMETQHRTVKNGALEWLVLHASVMAITALIQRATGNY